MLPLLRRLLADDRGQDLIEYALLTTFIGLAAIAVFDTLMDVINSAYGTFNTRSNALYAPVDPAGS